MRLAVISVILATVALVAAPGALADGDPASDVLVSLPYFDPVDLSLPASTSADLGTVIADGDRAGFPIRVAMIASATDLGTVTALWGKPEAYAQYLQTELSGLYPGQLLVVMPTGFGLAGPTSGPHAIKRAETAVKALAPGPGVKLAQAALSAVPLLAAADGHAIPSGTLAAAAHTRPAADRSTAKALSTGSLLALLLGVGMIVLSWRASLRRRPLTAHRRVEA